MGLDKTSIGEGLDAQSDRIYVWTWDNLKLLVGLLVGEREKDPLIVPDKPLATNAAELAPSVTA